MIRYDSDELQLGKNMGGSVDYTNRFMATLKTFPQKVNHSKPMILSQGTASSRNDSFFSVQSWMMADFTTSVPSGRGVQTLYWGADVDTLRFFKSFTKVKKSGKPGIFKAPSLALLKILLAMTSPTNEVSWEVWPPIIAKHVQDDIEVLRRVAKVGHKLLNDAGAGQVLAGECTQLEILCIYKKGRKPFFCNKCHLLAILHSFAFVKKITGWGNQHTCFNLVSQKLSNISWNMDSNRHFNFQ